MAGLLSKLKARINRLSRQNINPRVYTRMVEEELKSVMNGEVIFRVFMIGL